MRLKGELLFVCLLLLVVLSLSNVSSAACSIEASEADCDAITNGVIVMRLSDSDNAHGEMKTHTPADYEHVLCCNFGTGSSSCANGGKLMGLSSETNAHAERPDQNPPNYLNDVCYDGFDYCSSVDVGTPCAPDEIKVLQLFSTTNSHIGPLDPGGYPQKICCKIDEGITGCTLDSAYWSLDNIYPWENKLTGDTSVVEDTTMYLVVDGTDCNLIPITFEIFEDSLGSDETRQPDSPNPSFSSGRAITEWEVAWVDVSGNPKYYFEGITALSTITSDYLLEVTESEIDCLVDGIDFCSNYTSYGGAPTATEEGTGECIADNCGVAVGDVEATWSEIDCSSDAYKCRCDWIVGVCSPKWTYLGSCGDGSCTPGRENCNTCPGDPLDPLDGDCGTCPDPDCGDGTCASGEGEDCFTCPGDPLDPLDGDCGTCPDPDCGDGTCAENEKCGDSDVAPECNTDCGDCDDDENECGDTVCDHTEGEYCDTCPSDCDECPPAFCPDDYCAPNEDCFLCELDCGVCDPVDCGDGWCAPNEDCITCEEDCGICLEDLMGGCSFAESVLDNDNCDDGFLDYNWTGTWNGVPPTSKDFQYQNYQDCIDGGENRRACPTQVQLPFFEFYNVIAALVVIALVYVVLIFKRKKG